MLQMTTPQGHKIIYRKGNLAGTSNQEHLFYLEDLLVGSYYDSDGPTNHEAPSPLTKMQKCFNRIDEFVELHNISLAV